jgi:hypothetical protein
VGERQNIEWKQSWHDNYQKLLEDLPNKIRNAMGIICDVNLQEESGSKYIEIKVQPYSVPVSLRGRYYYRSGSTKMELIGVELNEFLLKKAGKTWDDVIEERASINDIDTNSLEQFIQDGLKYGRMPDVDGLSTFQILEKLNLIEKGQLKRAAIVCFPGIFYRGGAEQKIRKYLVDNNYVETIIALAPNLFYGTSIAVNLLVLSKRKTDTKTQFIDASGENFFKKVTNNNVLTDNDDESNPGHIQQIMKIFASKKEVPHVATSIDNTKIAENDYNLSVSSYVEPRDTREQIDIVKLNSEVTKTVEKIDKLRADIDAIIKEINA